MNVFTTCEWTDKIFNVKSNEFEALALEIFHFQYRYNPVYRQFTDGLGIEPAGVRSLLQIPFLPVRFFKSHNIQTTDFEPQQIFISSGTTQTNHSRHLVKDTGLYEESFLRDFTLFYGTVDEWCILGLLPSYLERGQSSLVYMVDDLIKKSKHPDSGFYLYNQEALAHKLGELEARKQKTLLIGVTYALLDFAERFPMKFEHTIIIETGGMKGRKKEMIRSEVHALLKSAFNLPAIHSEYGMTELLSQAYASHEGIYHTPPWMKILTREDDDPLTLHTNGSGVINIIDLANIYSCCFIATDDAGKLYNDGSFEISGRMDGSDLRGCSLLAI